MYEAGIRPAPLKNVRIGRLFRIWSFRICPRHPRKSGSHSGVRQLTGSMGRFTPPWFSPSRLATEVSLYCDGSSP